MTTLSTYRKDPLYPRVVRAVDSILKSGRVVAPVEVLLRMNLLKPEHLEDWRFGHTPYLERVINCNLTKLSRLLRILRFHAHDLNLKSSWTAYIRQGKGSRQHLHFTKTGDANLEKIYATHFVWPGKKPFSRAFSKNIRAAPDPARRLGSAQEASHGISQNRE